MATPGMTMPSSATGMSNQMCTNLNIGCAAFGAAIAYSGLDRAIEMLPPMAHYGLGGLVTSAWCQNGLTGLPRTDTDTLQAVLSAVAGGIGFTIIRPRLGL